MAQSVQYLLCNQDLSLGPQQPHENLGAVVCVSNV